MSTREKLFARTAAQLADGGGPEHKSGLHGHCIRSGRGAVTRGMHMHCSASDCAYVVAMWRMALKDCLTCVVSVSLLRTRFL
jgi:hypothetical protein